ncbi:unnamed protein product [Lactuca virosa]|uniref:RNA-dependent RNA polymerase n=1 Tax=Lactuca virosa TaxID=75947 RepID=A0AAU9P016_9ASTR|nr:unnamed protein product [Lactuca virosa]
MGLSSYQLNDTKVKVSTNSQGSKNLPPCLVKYDSDVYLKRLCFAMMFAQANGLVFSSKLKGGDYIFTWDGDIGLENFDAEACLRITYYKFPDQVYQLVVD